MLKQMGSVTTSSTSLHQCLNADGKAAMAINVYNGLFSSSVTSF